MGDSHAPHSKPMYTIYNIMIRNLSEAFSNINERLYGCTNAEGENTITPEWLRNFSEETDYLQKRMGLEPLQCILFAAVLAAHGSNRTAMNAVAKILGIDYLKLLTFSKDLGVLRDRGLIRLRGTNDISVPGPVILSLMKDEVYEKPRVDGLSAKALVRRVFAFVKGMFNEEYTHWQALEEIDILLNANPSTRYATACEKYINPGKVAPPERMLFHVMAYLHLQRDYTVFDMGDIEEYIKDDETMDTLRDYAETESLALQVTGVIEPAKADGFLEKGSFSFKDEVVKEMFADIHVTQTNLKTVDLDDLSNKPAKALFYNSVEKEQIQRLDTLLDEGNLRRVFASMKEKGLRTGLICLFYGDPGTGKTETVYQMARRTGRSILEADVARLRNCYVGETEKNMRALFSDYRKACEENELAPILLFNEADAILGTRMEGAVKSVDRMENSVQNILLQEMESFEGILIATTNLLGNLDPAFERRFLFKIRFNKPEVEPRRMIWKSQIPALSDSDALALAAEFPFSGGQIENVTRKYAIESILSGKDGDVEQLRLFCREESTGRGSRRRIGF